MKRIIALISAVVLVFCGLGGAAYAQESSENEVHAHFHTHYTYRTVGNSVGNVFSEQYAWLGADLRNIADSTHADVDSPILDLNADFRSLITGPQVVVAD